MKKVINSPKAPKAIGPYSQAIEVNGMIYISGQLPVDVNTGKFAEGGPGTNRTIFKKHRLYSRSCRLYL